MKSRYCASISRVDIRLQHHRDINPCHTGNYHKNLFADALLRSSTWFQLLGFFFPGPDDDGLFSTLIHPTQAAGRSHEGVWLCILPDTLKFIFSVSSRTLHKASTNYHTLIPLAALSKMRKVFRLPDDYIMFNFLILLCEYEMLTFMLWSADHTWPRSYPLFMFLAVFCILFVASSPLNCTSMTLLPANSMMMWETSELCQIRNRLLRLD